MKHHHFLLVCLPAQGHLNPSLQLAKSLTHTGAQVTFATTVRGLSRLKSRVAYNGLSYTSFSDGHDDESSKAGDPLSYMADLKRIGAENLRKLIQSFVNEGRPVTLLLYGTMLPWVAVVAREFNVPSAFLPCQSATAFAIYHKYFDSRGGAYHGVNDSDPSLISINLPDLPSFSSRDLPSFLLPSDQFFTFAPVFHEHFKILEEDPNPCALVNTFNDLEEASVKAVDNMHVIPIGPVIPSAFSDGNDPTDKSFGCDLFESSKSDYLQWLDSRPEHSVIYVSFGSLAVLKKEQKSEIFHGLTESGRPFLWVIRGSENEDGEEKSKFEEGLSGEGIIVPWCSQIEVLGHKSIGCFVTHCGWNSTIESLVSGVPMVGCPQFSDQITNAKMIEEIWGIGLRARADEEGLVNREEIKTCLDILMEGGDRGEEIRRNVVKWRDLALDAVKEGGSSHNNLKSFLESLG